MYDWRLTVSLVETIFMPINNMTRPYEAYIKKYKTNQHPNLAQYWDYKSASTDAILWRHNISKMVDGRRVKNGYIAVSQRKIRWFR